MLKHKLQEPLSVFRIQGLRAGFTAFLKFIVRLFYGRHEFLVFAYPVPQNAPAPIPNPGLEIRQVTKPEELTNIEAKSEAEDFTRFKKLFELGSVCFLAFREKEIAGYAWISEYNDKSVNSIQPVLNSGEALLHDLLVFPEFRRQGIAEILMKHRLKYLSDHGYGRGICGVDVENEASMKLHEKLGCQQTVLMVYKRFLFWGWVYRKPD